MEWQPIETAPKDAERAMWLLVDGAPYIGYLRKKSVRDRSSKERWIAKVSFQRGEEHDEIFMCHQSAKPTHWMPMPDPPQ